MTVVSAPLAPLLRDQLRSEVIKTRSARSLWLLPLLALSVPPVMAGVVGLTGSLEPDDTVLGGALTGTSLALAVIGAWAALVVTTEFGSGTIRPVLTATPWRDLLLAAKALLVVAVSTAVGVLAVTTAWLIGGAVIDGGTYAAGQPFPGMIGIYCCFPAVAVLGLAVGVAVRSSAGAVAVITAHVVLPQVTAAQALGELHKWVTVVAPSAVVAKLSQSSDGAAELMGSLGGWPRLALVAVGAVAALGMARRTLNRADI
ncbi:ABC transporter permease [Nocardia sp. CC227C]|uniref:ABC transporter permease n=1 Tax=Nocardia sp. CC227C TaxID=3044562 RepID=UPI00278BCAE2|nr:ABC transporter permease [Nocardia sp. CC227C]